LRRPEREVALKLDREQWFALSLVAIFPIVILLLSSMVGPISIYGSAGQQNAQAAPTQQQQQTITVTSTTFKTEQGAGGQVASSYNFDVLGQSSQTWADSYLILAIATVLLTAFIVTTRPKRKSTIVEIKTTTESQRNYLLVVLLVAFGGLLLLGFYLASLYAFPVVGGRPTVVTFAELDQLATITISLAIIGTSFYVLYRWRLRRKELRSFDARPADELLGILKKAASELAQENASYREIIFDCYKKVLILFEKLGVPQRSNFTPRESQREISEVIGVSFPQLEELTYLFEKAKYSNEELSREDITRARESLTRITVELEERLREGATTPTIIVSASE
jgi:hypothetical protein